MKEIQLTKGQFALVDDEDYELLSRRKWCAIKSKRGRTFYAIRAYKNGSGLMHRVILGLTNPKIHCDHIDHNGLNNQRSNLRVATSSQNNCNKPSAINSSSKYLGVQRHKRTGKWKAQIAKNRVEVTIGIFEKEIDAALAYNTKAIELHGAFANLNKV